MRIQNGKPCIRLPVFVLSQWLTAYAPKEFPIIGSTITYLLGDHVKPHYPTFHERTRLLKPSVLLSQKRVIPLTLLKNTPKQPRLTLSQFDGFCQNHSQEKTCIAVNDKSLPHNTCLQKSKNRQLVLFDRM
jgi:hypothetical protein